MGSNHLTFQQEKVYFFLLDYFQKHKRSPYIREIQVSCNFRSHKSAIDKLNSLEKKGYIKRTLNKHRNIRLIRRKEEVNR